MASRAVMLMLLGIYIVLIVCCLFEKSYPKAMYWLGAAIINSSILVMK